MVEAVQTSETMTNLYQNTASDLYAALQSISKMCLLIINNMSALTVEGALAFLGNTDGIAAKIKQKIQRHKCALIL
jgi:hypothetical protein